MLSRSDFKGARRIVVKIGSSLLTGGGRGLDHPAIAGWVAQIAALGKDGNDVVLVSSGSVAEGMSRLGLDARPQSLHALQAAAAVGQMGLVQTYETLFSGHGWKTAQILLTHDDLANRQRYLNARSTLLTLLGLRVIPIINENDTVATEEIRFGDNDTLAALVGNLIEADLVIILTDIAGLYECDPRDNPKAKLVSEAPITDACLDAMAGGSRSGLGRGGMHTKLRAARLAARSGAGTIIAAGREPSVLERIIAGEEIGTFLVPDTNPLLARKRWMVGQLNLKGALVLDQGAVTALRDQGKSLLPIGVTSVRGTFARGDLVACLGPDDLEVGRGLVNYGSIETQRILRQPSHKIAELLGYIDEDELIHRDNLVLND